MATDTKLVAGLALDALIAEKVMGWTRSEDGNFVQPDGWRRGLDVAEWEEDRGSFHPSTDIAAAWEVVEKVNDHDFILEWQGENNWHCDMKGACVHGMTAPEAICRAALQTVGYHAD